MKTLICETNMSPVLKRPVLNEAGGQSGSSWAVQIWNLGERNLNGRTYTKDLAERLVVESKTTLCMDGHNSYSSEYANAMAYAHDPYIENGFMCVHFDFIDKNYEDKIQFCLEHNIPVGVSSVGYGSMDEHGVVDAETYELVRYFDFVQTPANETYVAQKKEEHDGHNAKESVAKPAGEAASSTEDNLADGYRSLALMMHREHTF